MSTLAELARQHTALSKEDVAHLQGLISEWGMLADFCFADLLLYVPSEDERWLVVGHVRAATGQTLYKTDWVGDWADFDERAAIVNAHNSGRITEGEMRVDGIEGMCKMLAIPVRCNGQVIGILTREWSPRIGRQLGELETTYLEIFERFADMISAGRFPFHARAADSSVAPRVGDGVLVLDAGGVVRYASPNGTSALHRVGINGNVVGLTLAELGVVDSSVRQAFERLEPVVEEFDQNSDITLLTRCIPMVSGTNKDTKATGAVMLLRDVTELRRRDRLLLSKDATIREIHHRVKNNLQTISSLLRLQSRRLKSEEAREAVAESVRRIRTIALVHETLSREPGEDVPFIEIVRPLVRLAEEGLQSVDRPVRLSVQGEGGRLPATVATPLSVVLTELLQNAIDHAFPDDAPSRNAGVVVVQLENNGEELRVRVLDNGIGLSDEFDLKSSQGLGLSIVRTLVTTELAGTITMRPGLEYDALSMGIEPVSGNLGTVVELRIPISTQD
jgi:two-component system, sensor histidine kinase PdtaS